MSDFDSSRLRIGVIGPGRVGCAVAAGWANAGHAIRWVSAISERSINRARHYLPAAELVDPIDLVAMADLVLITVSDDELVDLVAGLAQVAGFRPGQLVVHTSGGHGLLPLLPAIDQGAIGMALHPAMTFTGGAEDVARLEACPFGVTAPAPFTAVAEALVIELGGEPVLIDDADRPRYHAALTHAANHLNTLVSQSADELAAIGVLQPGKFLEPLTTAALERALVAGPLALTGPVMRGDVETVRLHLASIGDPLVLATYRQLAAATVEMAEQHKVLTAAKAAQLRKLLAP